MDEFVHTNYFWKVRCFYRTKKILYSMQWKLRLYLAAVCRPSLWWFACFSNEVIDTKKIVCTKKFPFSFVEFCGRHGSIWLGMNRFTSHFKLLLSVWSCQNFVCLGVAIWCEMSKESQNPAPYKKLLLEDNTSNK